MDLSGGKINVPVNPLLSEYKSEFAIRWEETRSPEYKEYRRKWTENAKGFILEDGPLNLDIESTNCCNLKCPMCPRTIMVRDDIPVSGGRFETGYMDFGLYRNLIDQAVEIGVKAVKLNWMGEPTLHKRLPDMVKYAKEKGILDVLINTNAVLLDEKLAAELIESGLDKLLFSFDSPFKEDYERIRVGADFEKVLENIKNVKRIRNELGIDTPLTRASMVIMKENAGQFNDFVELFRDIVDIVARGECTNEQGLVGEERKAARREKLQSFACAQLWQRMFVTWNGKVVVCCADVKMGYVVGDAAVERLKDIWRNEKYRYIREKHKSGEYNDIPICAVCDLPGFDEKK